jgi:hypothetical protein
MAHDLQWYRRSGGLTPQLGERLVPRPEELRPSVDHHQHEVDAGERAGPVRDHDGDTASRPHPCNRLGQRFLAFGIQIGIGLVEHHQERLAVERTRQSNSLLLAGGERSAAFANLGLVAVRQMQDHLMDAGGHGGRNDRLRGRCAFQPSDVLRDGAREQLHALREIADVTAQCARRPLIEPGLIQTHGSPDRLPNSDERTRKG